MQYLNKNVYLVDVNNCEQVVGQKYMGDFGKNFFLWKVI